MCYKSVLILAFVIPNNSLIRAVYRPDKSLQNSTVMHNLAIQNPDEYFVTLESHQLHRYPQCKGVVHTSARASTPVYARQSREGCCDCPKELFVIDSASELVSTELSTFWLTVERLGPKDVCRYAGSLTLLGPSPHLQIMNGNQGKLRINVRDCSLAQIGA